MRIQVKLFAMLREAKGTDELEVEVPEGTTVSGVLARVFPYNEIGRQVPGTMLFAVNRVYAPADHPLKDGDEVVFVPPVSGG